MRCPSLAADIKSELDKIDEALGHYSGCGGPAPPYHKTNDDEIKTAVACIRELIK